MYIFFHFVMPVKKQTILPESANHHLTYALLTNRLFELNTYLYPIPGFVQRIQNAVFNSEAA